MGLAASRRLAEAGATVVLADREGAAAETAAGEIRDSGGKALARQVDVSSLDSLKALFEFVGAACGGLNVFFSHAGVQGPPGLDLTEAQFDAVMNVNVKSHFFATRYALPLLKASATKASIIYTSSTAGIGGGSHSPLYAISKAAIVMMTRSIARQLGPDRIRLNAICPGPVESAFSRDFARQVREATGQSEESFQARLNAGLQAIPLGGIGQADDVSGLVLFLASDASSYLTGTAIPVDGGLTA